MLRYAHCCTCITNYLNRGDAGLPYPCRGKFEHSHACMLAGRHIHMHSHTDQLVVPDLEWTTCLSGLTGGSVPVQL